MNERSKPVLSAMQFAPGDGPKCYMPFPNAPPSLTILHSQFNFAHHDLCLFHQALYIQVIERDNAAEEYMSKAEAMFQHHNRANNGDRLEEVRLSRVRDAVRTLELETSSIKAYADQLLVVACWAMVEQYCGRTLIATERELGAPPNRIEAPHRWQDLARRLAHIGVDVSQCENFHTIDECRIVNNKIKHVGFVDKELAKRPAFSGNEGRKFDDVSLPLQTYVNAVWEFVGCVMEFSGIQLVAQGYDYRSHRD